MRTYQADFISTGSAPFKQAKFAVETGPPGTIDGGHDYSPVQQRSRPKIAFREAQMENTNTNGNGLPSARDAKGRFGYGNDAARAGKNGRKRPNYRLVVLEELTEEGLAQSLRGVIATASDNRKSLAQLKAAELLCRLAGLLNTSVQLSTDESGNPADRRAQIEARLAEILAPQSVPDSGTRNEFHPGG
jgi:hypothetical protein